MRGEGGVPEAGRCFCVLEGVVGGGGGGASCLVPLQDERMGGARGERGGGTFAQQGQPRRWRFRFDVEGKEGLGGGGMGALSQMSMRQSRSCDPWARVLASPMGICVASESCEPVSVSLSVPVAVSVPAVVPVLGSTSGGGNGASGSDSGSGSGSRTWRRLRYWASLCLICRHSADFLARTRVRWCSSRVFSASESSRRRSSASSLNRCGRGGGAGRLTRGFLTGAGGFGGGGARWRRQWPCPRAWQYR